MQTPRHLLPLAPAALVALAACSRAPEQAPAAPRATPAAQVDDARIAAWTNDSEWLSYGRTYSEQRFSPLRQIDEQTVARLGLVWSIDLQTLRGLEATPLVSDGVLFTTSAWSVVYAIDARSGAVRWRYDPEVPKDHAKFVCCDVVNRGVALYRGRVYVGTIDARLIALDAGTGKPVWAVQTTPQDGPYAITGAPSVASMSLFRSVQWSWARSLDRC
jgi:quinohemoprotein ethanol dehydrogenase